MLQAVDEIPDGIVERGPQGMRGILDHIAKQSFDRLDDLLIDLVIQNGRHPPRRLGAHAVANHVPVVPHRVRREADCRVEQLLLAVVGERQRERLAERGRDAKRPHPVAHDVSDQLLDLVARQGLERLGQAARELSGDLTGVLAVGQPQRGPLRRMHAAQICADHVTRQEVLLDECAEDLPDPFLARGNDGGVRDGNAQRMLEECRHREPVGQTAHEGGLGRRADVAQPRVLRLEHQGHDEDQQRDGQQPGGAPLHRV